MSFSSLTKFLVAAAAVLVFTGCGSDDDDPMGSMCDDATSQSLQTAGAAAIQANCVGCHSATSANRNGAPASVNFDTPADIAANEVRIENRAVTLMTMPPSGPLSADDISGIVELLNCN